MKKLLTTFLALLLLVGCLNTSPLQAATPKTAAPAYNGKWTYYAVKNTIYKLNSQTGSAKKVKTISSTSNIPDISYYKGYLYFTANDYAGSDSSECFVCRMKTNGSGYKKLTRGYGTIVYNNRIYYVKLKHMKTSDYYEYDSPLGIYSMKLNGKNKTLIKKCSQDLSFVMSKGNLYYSLRPSSDSMVYCYNISKKATQRVSAIDFELQVTDGTYIAGSDYDYTQQREFLRVYNTSTKSVTTIASGRFFSSRILAIKNAKVYYTDSSAYPTYKYCCYNIKTGKTTLLSSGKRHYTQIILSKSGYCPVTVYLSPEEMKKSNYRYDIAAGRFQLNGKKVKLLRKYFVS